jgi:DNA-directed RNA polymerase subunit RPC12/RpoP
MTMAEKSGYRCFKCNKRFLSRSQLTLWGDHYWCSRCIDEYIAERDKEQTPKPLHVSPEFQSMMDSLLPEED